MTTPSTRTVTPAEKALFEQWARRQRGSYILNHFTRSNRYADLRTQHAFEGFMGCLEIAKAGRMEAA